MALEIQTSDNIQQPKTAWFLYGAMGSGKTRAAASFPSPLFLIPANEGSELTLKQLTDKKIPFVRMGKRADGTVVKVRQHIDEIMSDLEKRHTQMWAGLARADQMRAAGRPEEECVAAEREAAALFPWETIVVESLTHLGDLLVDDVGDMGKKKMDQQGWGVISTFLRTLHSRLRNLDAHIVYTSLAKVQMDDDGGVVAGGPNLIGSMAEKLPSACDTVVYMEELPAQGKDGPVYRAFLRRYKKWHARTRFGGLPDFVDTFDFGKLSKQFA